MDEQQGRTGPDHEAPAGSTRTDDPFEQTGTGAPHAGGPRVTGSQVRDLSRLRRSSTDRYLGGVAGGLGRHLDVDPTVIRVVLVVMTFFGGAGLILYVALWLLLPSDESRATIRVGPEVQAAVVIGVVAIAALVFLGSTFSDQSWGFGFPLLFVLIGVAVVFLAVRDRRDTRERSAFPPGGPTMSTTYPPTPTDGPPATPPTTPPAPPSWVPPQPPPYVPPPRARRTGIVLFWPTLAVIAIALGTLGVVDTSSSIPVSAYAALAVAVVGVMLVVGAFVGRPGGLIFLGLVTSAVMLVSSGVHAATGGDTREQDVRIVPRTTSDLASAYHVGTGSLTVDLRGLADPAALDGRTLDVSVNAGEILVQVPQGVQAHVTGHVRYAGQVTIGDAQRGGLDQTLERTLGPTTAGTPVLQLDLRVRVGQITVTQTGDLS